MPPQQWAREGRSAVWYRVRFPRPDHDGRVILRLGGAFLAVNAWMNGRFLGSHYGYFAPFGFDIAPFLRNDNLVVLCCESPVETDLARKRHVMGIFNDGDSRPYPGTAWFSLPTAYRWEVPVGLWRQVELEYTGPVILDWVGLRPRVEAGDVGRVEIEARLRNLDGRQMAGEVAVEVEGPGLSTPLRLRRAISMAGVSEQTVEMTLTIPRVERWWPWRLGEPLLYRATTTVTVRGRESVQTKEHFGFREVTVNAGVEGWAVLVNGQPMFLRGANYCPGLQLDQLDEDVFRRDLELARNTNLDALRVHGHVLPEEFYRLADEAGMLVVADFPLTLSYGYHASSEETRFFESAVRDQVPEMVELLHNRPSVMLWVGHDDPPWVPANASLGDVHAVRQNHTIDQEIKASLESLDPSRTALAASGDLDHHLWFGWREGGWHQFAEVLPALVSEFGAQALPTLESPVWDALGRRWPVAPDDPGWLYAGFQLAAWAERGAGLPDQYSSLEEYVEESQIYQAWLCSYAIDQLRKRKFEPCWGAFVYGLTDTFPGIGFGLVDGARLPRLALEAVRDAFAPLRVIIDPVGFKALVPYGVGWRPGDEAAIRLVVVNDDPQVEGTAEVRWEMAREQTIEPSGMGRLLDAVRRRSWGGSIPVTLPTVAEPALQVTTLNFPVLTEGKYHFEAELRAHGMKRLRAVARFEVSDALPLERPRPLLPDYLAERIVVQGSLSLLDEGLRFALRNRTRPAVLTALHRFHLDGQRLDAPRLFLETEAGRVPFPRKLELPVDRDVPVLLELPQTVEPGEHELEMDLTVPGVASGRVRVKGRVLDGRAV
jgi:beta-mannosidase